MVEKYIVMRYNDYEAQGGIHDISGSFKTIEQARQFIIDKNKSIEYDNSEIVDHDTWEIVETYERDTLLR